MPKYRDVYLEKDKVLADSGTHTIDISPIDPISELLVKFYATNGATSNKGFPIARAITKIEIVDGADVIFSMDGRLAHALMYYHTGVFPQQGIREAGNYVQHINIPIRFGRWLWDPIIALDPSRFKNLQMKISWNLAAVNAVGATGFVTGTAQLSVIAKVMAEAVAKPTHFLMHKDQYSWTTGASGDERIPLPTDYPFVGMMLRAWEAGVSVETTISNVKLNIDFDKDIPIDLKSNDLRGRIINKYGKISNEIIFLGNNAEVHRNWFSSVFSLAAVPNASGIIAGIATLDAESYSLYLVDHTGAAQTGVTVFVTTFGQIPWNCMYIPFGILEDPTTYLQSQDHGDIKAIITQGNADAEANIVLSQMRNYK